jgi:hypothetical protein
MRASRSRCTRRRSRFVEECVGGFRRHRCCDHRDAHDRNRCSNPHSVAPTDDWITDRAVGWPLLTAAVFGFVLTFVWMWRPSLGIICCKRNCCERAKRKLTLTISRFHNSYTWPAFAESFIALRAALGQQVCESGEDPLHSLEERPRQPSTVHRGLPAPLLVSSWLLCDTHRHC